MERAAGRAPGVCGKEAFGIEATFCCCLRLPARQLRARTAPADSEELTVCVIHGDGRLTSDSDAAVKGGLA